MPDQQPLTKEYLLKQGSCCGSCCTHCPYDPKHIEGTVKIKK